MYAQEVTEAERKVYVCICICVNKCLSLEGLLARSWEMGHRKVIFLDFVCRNERHSQVKKLVEVILNKRKYIQRYRGEVEHKKECWKNWEGFNIARNCVLYKGNKVDHVESYGGYDCMVNKESIYSYILQSFIHYKTCVFTFTFILKFDCSGG